MNIKDILKDKKNIEILKLLQRDPRMSIAELSRKIKMSNPAAKERVRRLEESGVIAAIVSNWIRKQRDMKSRRSSESGRFPDMCRKSQRSLNRFPRLWNAIESRAKIASFLRSICLRSRLWIVCWIAFWFMGRRRPPSCSPRPYLHDRYLFRRLLLARTRSVGDLPDDPAVVLTRRFRNALQFLRFGLTSSPMGNTFGQLFRVTTFGESHGGGVGVVIDGCPPNIELSEREIQRELDRRRPGQSKVTTQRKEADQCEILSGVFEGKTLGTPIAILVRNKDARPEEYAEIAEKFRPSHADFTYEAKYGIRNWQGGGRASARETIGRVAAGAVAKKILSALYAEFEIVAYVAQIYEVAAKINRSAVKARDVEKNIVRCPDASATKKMVSLIEDVRVQGDSVGGVIECVARGIPPGIGEPVFDKLEADLAKAMLSIPATKGFEIGSGFAATRMRGSQHNDPFEMRGGKIRAATNNSGGVQGGISNGEEIYFRVAFKPTATIGHEQKTVTSSRQQTRLAARGRHDPCVLPRAVPIVEAMAALVFVIMLCVNERLRLQIADRGLRSGKPGDAERSSIRNSDHRSRAREHFRCRQSAIRDFIGGWVATLAGGFHFFWRHFDLI